MEFNNIFIEKSGADREEYELMYLLDRMTVQEIATQLNISTIVVRNHMHRNISKDTREKLVNYLPSTAAQVAELLVKVKSKSIDLLEQQELEDRDIRLLNTLIQSTTKFVEKWGQVSEGIAGINTGNTTNNFERACMEVLVDYPDVFLKIKEKMTEYDS